jgi:hypothetical protein
MFRKESSSHQPLELVMALDTCGWLMPLHVLACSRYWVSLGASSWLSSGLFGLGVQNFVKIGCGYAF